MKRPQDPRLPAPCKGDPYPYDYCPAPGDEGWGPDVNVRVPSEGVVDWPETLTLGAAAPAEDYSI